MLNTAMGDLERIQLLVKQDADIKAKNKAGRTPLCIAARSGLLEVVKYLVEKGADTTIKTYFEKTA